MNKRERFPVQPPWGVVSAPTQITMEGFPPEEFVSTVSAGSWEGKLLMGRGSRIEEVWNGTAGQFGALAVLVRLDDKAAHVTLTAGDLYQEFQRIMSDSRPGEGERSRSVGRYGGRIYWEPDTEVVAVLLPTENAVGDHPPRVALWLAEYLRHAGAVVENLALGVKPQSKKLCCWMKTYLSSLAVILEREYVTRDLRLFPARFP